MVVDTLIKLLNTLTVDKVLRQGTLLLDETYPELFITFWENESYDGNHYDNNKENGVIYDFDINVYGSDFKKVYQTMEEAIELLKANNFIVNGKGYDIPSDEPNFIGRHINIKYIEY